MKSKQECSDIKREYGRVLNMVAFGHRRDSFVNHDKMTNTRLGKYGTKVLLHQQMYGVVEIINHKQIKQY